VRFLEKGRERFLEGFEGRLWRSVWRDRKLQLMGSRPLTAFAAYRQEWKEIIENFVELKLFLTFPVSSILFELGEKLAQPCGSS
jgi:hypothetical protein